MFNKQKPKLILFRRANTSQLAARMRAQSRSARNKILRSLLRSILLIFFLSIALIILIGNLFHDHHDFFIHNDCAVCKFIFELINIIYFIFFSTLQISLIYLNLKIIPIKNFIPDIVSENYFLRSPPVA